VSTLDRGARFDTREWSGHGRRDREI